MACVGGRGRARRSRALLRAERRSQRANRLLDESLRFFANPLTTPLPRVTDGIDYVLVATQTSALGTPYVFFTNYDIARPASGPEARARGPGLPALQGAALRDVVLARNQLVARVPGTAGFGHGRSGERHRGQRAAATVASRRRLSADWEIWGPMGGYVAACALRAAGASTEQLATRPRSRATTWASLRSAASTSRCRRASAGAAPRRNGSRSPRKTGRSSTRWCGASATATASSTTRR